MVADEFEPLKTIVHSLFTAGAKRVLIAYDAASAVRICHAYKERIDVFVGQSSGNACALEPVRVMMLNRQEVQIVVVAENNGIAAAWPVPVIWAQVEPSAIKSAIDTALGAALPGPALRR